MTSRARVAVVGAGIAGAACAQALRVAGVDADLIERGRAPGGRMAAPTVHGRRVDLGAAYFTVKNDEFADQVGRWRTAGLVRDWADTLDTFGSDGRGQTSGPMRLAAVDGLRSLVRDLIADVTVASEVHELAELDHDAVVLAMPDPQAARLIGDAIEWVDYEPVITVAAGWDERYWTLDAAFVNDDPDITLIADDGARRGDAAPVLVIHSSSPLAAGHLGNPDAAIAPVVAAARRWLAIDTAPSWTHAHRWMFAKPVGTHGDAPFGLVQHHGRTVGVCGDSWCPSGAPRVEAAWLSGLRLGRELGGQLGRGSAP